MNHEQESARDVGCWASLVLRLAIAALFTSAAIGKLKGGMESIKATVGYFQSTFAETWLPGPMVTLHGYMTPFIEAIIPIWLILGWRLKYAWLFAGLFMISLSFGMSVAGNHAVAAGNYNYVLICAVGLYFSRFDCLNVDAMRRPR